MASSRRRSQLVSALALGIAAGCAMAGGAQAQLRGQISGQVGQPLPDPTQTQSAFPAPATPTALPTLEEELRAQTARRRARERARAVAAAPTPVINPRTRPGVQQPVRRIGGLSRPANRAVSARPGAAGAASQPLPQVVSPGLSAPAAARRRPVAEEDPYAPLGLRLGGVIVRPAIEVSAGYDTNPLRTAGSAKVKGSKVVQVAPEVSVESDWSRHRLQFDLRGTYNRYSDVENANRPTLDARLQFRGDVGQNSTVNLELRERIDSQRPGSIDLTSAVKGRPLVYTTTGSAGWTEKLGYATLTATGVVDRADFEDGKTFSGLTVPQGDRNYTTYGGRLRGAYEITPGIAPYVEVGADTRRYDQKIDTSGFERSSTGATVKAGSTFEITRTLTADVSAGYGQRVYEDGRLQKLGGALVDASLLWQVSPLTRVTLRAASEFAETTQAGSPGAISRRVGVEATHDLLRNLSFTATASYTHADYLGVSRIEQALAAGLRADYKIDRNFVFRASYGYERAISSLANNGYAAHVFLAGVRIQR